MFPPIKRTDKPRDPRERRPTSQHPFGAPYGSSSSYTPATDYTPPAAPAAPDQAPSYEGGGGSFDGGGASGD